MSCYVSVVDFDIYMWNGIGEEGERRKKREGRKEVLGDDDCWVGPVRYPVSVAWRC